MAMLKRIQLKGYKSIREMDLELGPLNILIGANGAGKSNLLSFFYLCNVYSVGILNDYISICGGAYNFFHYGAERTPVLESTIQIETEKGIYKYQLDFAYSANDSMSPLLETVSYDGLPGNSKTMKDDKGVNSPPGISEANKMTENSFIDFISADWTPIHANSAYGTTKILEELLNEGADINARTVKGFTPFHLAVIFGRKDIADFLISNGVDVDVTDEFGQTSLYHTVIRGMLELVKYLIDRGAKVNIADKLGNYPLHFAVHYGNEDLVNLLLDNGADPNIAGEKGFTPLHIACLRNNPNIVKILLDKGGKASLNSRLTDGSTALHLAYHSDNSQIVEILITNGADINIRNDAGFTPEKINLISRIETLKQIFSNWYVYHFINTPLFSPIKTANKIIQNQYLFDSGGNLASFLFRIKNEFYDHYNRIEDTVRLIYPRFRGFYLEPEVLNSQTIKLAWNEEGFDKPVYSYIASEGFLRMVCLVTLLMQPNLPELIIIDEPELGLHPYAITILADLIKIASQKTQLIVATQSVTLVDHFAPEDIIVADREGDESVFHRLNPEELTDWLEDYTLGELWQKNVIGGRP